MSTEVIAHVGPDELADAVARRLIALIAAAQAEDRVPHIALTGGTIAERIHRRVRALAESLAGPVDWSRVELWWGDERFVAADSEERNAGQARSDLLDALPLDPARVHEMPSTDSGLSLDDAALAYAKDLRERGSGRFDLVMLGVGPDGHVASLFPGHPQLQADGIATSVADSPKPPPERITLTFPALNRAAEVWFVVAGSEKADAVRRALADDGDVETTPARGVVGQRATRWFVTNDVL